MCKIHEVEASVWDLAKEVLAAERQRLAATGLEVRRLGIRRYQSDSGVSSEIQITLWHDGRFASMIEFPIYWRGGPAGTDAELRDCLNENVDLVIAEAQAEYAAEEHLPPLGEGAQCPPLK